MRIPFISVRINSTDVMFFFFNITEYDTINCVNLVL